MAEWEHKIGRASELSEKDKREFMRLVENLESLIDNHADQPNTGKPPFERVKDGVIWATKEETSREVVASILVDSNGYPLIGYCDK